MGGLLDYLSIELFSLVRVIRVFRGQKKPITKQIFKLFAEQRRTTRNNQKSRRDLILIAVGKTYGQM